MTIVTEGAAMGEQRLVPKDPIIFWSKKGELHGNLGYGFFFIAKGSGLRADQRTEPDWRLCDLRDRRILSIGNLRSMWSLDSLTFREEPKRTLVLIGTGVLAVA